MKIELDPHPELPRPQAPPKLPAPEPTANPYRVPHSPLVVTPEVDLAVEEVAKAQRMLLYSVLASLIGNVLVRMAGAAGLFLFPVLIAIAVFNIRSVYKLCRALDRSPVLWIIAMFIPLVNLICLLVLNSRATAFLRSRGVQVGFMGAKA